MFFVSLVSPFMTKMILNHITSLNSKINSKVTYKKVVMCGNQGSLYALSSQTIFRIVLRVFRTTHNRRF